MAKINTAIYSYGNIGRAIAAVHKLEAQKPDNDIQISGIVTRNPELAKEIPEGAKAVKDISELSDIDVVFYAGPSHLVRKDVAKLLEAGLCVVDCFDNHSEINELIAEFDAIAKRTQAVSIVADGWDPGFDSVQRVLFQALAPQGETFTTFGPGRSMGHTTTVKSIAGVVNAVSLTLPGNTPGTHKRDVYVTAENPSMQEQIEKAIKAHPYFVKDETSVSFVDDISKYDTIAHGGWISSESKNVKVECKLSGSNPIMTANMMYSAARMAHRAKLAKDFGAYTIAERPLLDLVAGDTAAERRLKIKF